jgi:hypothetical protein
MFTFRAPCKRKLIIFAVVIFCAVWLHLALSELNLAKYIKRHIIYLGAIYIHIYKNYTDKSCYNYYYYYYYQYKKIVFHTNRTTVEYYRKHEIAPILK